MSMMSWTTLFLANGKATQALYDMLISFGRMSEPLTKVRMVTLTSFLYAGGDMKKVSKETTIILLIFRLVGQFFFGIMYALFCVWCHSCHSLITIKCLYTASYREMLKWQQVALNLKVQKRLAIFFILVRFYYYIFDKLITQKRGISLVGIPLFCIVFGLFQDKHCSPISLIVS